MSFYLDAGSKSTLFSFSGSVLLGLLGGEEVQTSAKFVKLPSPHPGSFLKAPMALRRRSSPRVVLMILGFAAHLGQEDAYHPNTCPIALRASLPALAMKPISELMLIKRIPCCAQRTAIPTSLM